jgi:hypothetical protein
VASNTSIGRDTGAGGDSVRCTQGAVQPGRGQRVSVSVGHTLCKLALCAVLGLAAAGCQGNQAGSGSVTARTAPAGHASGGTVHGPAAAAPTVAGLADVYVVADCAAAAPYALSREPSSITIACADAGIGVQDMTWVTWTTTAATGGGLLWEKLCVPDCATGKIGYYPVDVTLSAVRASATGRWFSELTVSWEGSRPPNRTPDAFTLMPPD